MLLFVVFIIIVLLLLQVDAHMYFEKFYLLFFLAFNFHVERTTQ